MLVKTYGSAVYGVNAMTVTIEVNLSGSSGYAIVGLPDIAVRESKERVEAAIKNIRYEYPRGRITVNMAPADIRKEGSAYDLPIAIGILAASGQLKRDIEDLKEYLIMGELSLDGEVRPIRGALPIAIQARAEKYKAFLLPSDNSEEAGVVNKLEVIPVRHLTEAISYLENKLQIPPVNLDTRLIFEEESQHFGVDFSDVRGQDNVKRALEIAAAGAHNAILIGPPGSGKSMLAKRLPTILPPLTLEEALETTKVHSVAGKMGKAKGLTPHRPYRAPHHTISDVALVGGGNNPQPGEISLAHNGVLFMDELPEFKRSVLEVMRQPLEERMISIDRAKFSVNYPCNFMLLASMNPCPCGFYNHPEKECVCGAGVVAKYLSRISGPLLDRIDLQIEVTPVPFDDLASKVSSEKSASIRARVIKARERQAQRFKTLNAVGIYSNSMMSTPMIREVCILDKPSENLLKQAMNRLKLSARAYDRILKVARTIADLDAKENIEFPHISEAVSYRNLDREGWGGL